MAIKKIFKSALCILLAVVIGSSNILVYANNSQANAAEPTLVLTYTEGVVTSTVENYAKTENLQYSFDNGASWQAENFITVPENEEKNWAIGELQVRVIGSQEILLSNTEEVSKNQPAPTTTPESDTPETTPESDTPETTPESDTPTTLPESDIPTTLPESDIPTTLPENEEPELTPEQLQAKIDADKIPPMAYVEVNGRIVTVHATDNVQLRSNAYSFDSGITWQESNIYTLPDNVETKEFNPYNIMVIDSNFNLWSNKQIFTLPSLEEGSVFFDKIPTFTLDNTGKTVAINMDNEAHETDILYSFNGGDVWQRYNRYYVIGEKEWQSGEIIVRVMIDGTTHTSYNTQVVKAHNTEETDTTGPAVNINVNENVVTIEHLDGDMLPETPYSFNGGLTWQAENTYTVSQGQEKIWTTGAILVKNTHNYVSMNQNEIKAPVAPPVVEDNTPPIVSLQTAGRTLTVFSIDETALHAEAYSFDGGVTWSSNNIFTAPVGNDKVFAINEIQVRDAVGNVTGNTAVYYLPIPIVDVTPPSMTVVVDGAVLQVSASDNEELHQAPYSFDNGQTWTTSGRYSIDKGEKTFAANEIQVRDKAGNITKSNNAYTLKVEVFSTSAMIDVSAHQGIIDWKAVADSGIDYAIMRATTWSGDKDGYWVLDSQFESNVKNAKANGIEVGVYIYTYAFDTVEANQEMAIFMASAKKLHSQGYYFDLPVFIDYEYEPILGAIDNLADRTALLKYQMDLLDNAGYYPAMYMSTNWALNHVNVRQLQDQGYDLWIADYRASAIANGHPGYNYNIMAWQYTGKSSVPGIGGNVDMNYLYKDYSTLITGSDNGGQEVTPSDITVYDVNTGTRVTDSRENIIAAIVNNEVGNIYLTGADRYALYKAQAVAANSWLQYRLENQNTVPVVGLKYDGNYNLVKDKIAPVKNQYLTYNGKAANTFYGSSSNGKTNTPQDYWGSTTNFPYLTLVDSPYDVNVLQGATNYQNVVKTRTTSQMESSIRALGGNPTGDPSTWINITSRNPASGYVTGVTVGGKAITPAQFYESGLGAISPDFEVSYSSGTFTISSDGYGHGIGMSQFGAAGYIATAVNGVGKTYQEVLAIYFPGTQLQTMHN